MEEVYQGISGKYGERKLVIWAFIILGCSLFITVLLIIFKENFKRNFDFTELAALGDYLGGMITAFLTISTILLVYATYRTQQKELSATRKQLEATVEQAEISNETMKIQRFETTFFNMVNMHSDLINNLTLFGREMRGREVILNFYEQINKEYYYLQFNDHIEDILFNCDENKWKSVHNEVTNIINQLSLNVGYLNLTDFQDRVSKVNGKIHNNNVLEIIGFYNDRDVYRLFKRKMDFPVLLGSYLEKEHQKQHAYNVCNKVSKYCLSNYIKSIKTIIRIVDAQTIDYDQKNRYLNIFFSQFTVYEITVIKYVLEFEKDAELNGYFSKYSSLNTKDILEEAIINN